MCAKVATMRVKATTMCGEAATMCGRAAAMCFMAAPRPRPCGKIGGPGEMYGYLRLIYTGREFAFVRKAPFTAPPRVS